LIQIELKPLIMTQLTVEIIKQQLTNAWV